MLYKCKDKFTFRLDKIYYIKLNEEGYALVYMNYDGEPYPISIEDYIYICSNLIQMNNKFFMTSKGDVFNIDDISLMGFDEDNNWYYAYIFDKEECPNIFFIIDENDFNNILTLSETAIMPE